MSDYSFSERWTAVLAAKSISTPTAVQRQVIPQLQDGTHLLFESETGTGKTLAYLLPLLEKIDASDSHVQLVVVAPTHELCSQIKGEVQSVSDLRTALLIGGAPLKRQQDLLKEKPQVIIGGPVRLAELIHLKKLKVDGVKAIVFDEVDRLLAPELRDETCMLLGLMPEGRQVVACSATAKPKLAEILSEACSDKPVLKLEQLPKEDVLRKRISHWAIFAEERSKIDTLRRFLSAEKPQKALVFTARPDQAMNIVYKLQYKKVDCEVLHARQDKQERKAAIDRFRSGKTPVLVTSDLAARGLDFPGITHIIQMDVPTNDDFFVHRAGRTARSGLTGINVCIGDAHEMRTLRRLERRLELTVYPKMLHNGQVISPDQFMEAEDFEDEETDGGMTADAETVVGPRSASGSEAGRSADDRMSGGRRSDGRRNDSGSPAGRDNRKRGGNAGGERNEKNARRQQRTRSSSDEGSASREYSGSRQQGETPRTNGQRRGKTPAAAEPAVEQKQRGVKPAPKIDENRPAWAPAQSRRKK